MIIKFKLVDSFKQITLHILKSEDVKNSASGLQHRNLPLTNPGTIAVATYWGRNDPDGQVSGSRDQEFVFYIWLIKSKDYHMK